jgi:hypothetical protein
VELIRGRGIEPGTFFSKDGPMMRIATLSAACLVALTAMAAPASAQRARTKVGTLDCDISAGMGMIIGSRKEVRCAFTAARGRPEYYVGTISKFGLDIGATAGGRMIWNVLADTTLRHGALAGSYAGASGEASVGAGLGANVLVGGNARTVALQPVSIQAQAGLNVAVGVTGLELAPAR